LQSAGCTFNSARNIEPTRSRVHKGQRIDQTHTHTFHRPLTSAAYQSTDQSIGRPFSGKQSATEQSTESPISATPNAHSIELPNGDEKRRRANARPPSPHAGDGCRDDGGTGLSVPTVAVGRRSGQRLTPFASYLDLAASLRRRLNRSCVHAAAAAPIKSPSQ